MRQSQGYELTATANGPRLQAEVLVRLIADAERTDPARRPLVFGHREWYEAFLERTQLPAARAPLYVRLSYEIGQDLSADYRRERVIDEVLQGPSPVRAANVRIWWEKAPGKPEELTYDDTLSDPKLRVTQSRVMTYRLVDYGDRVWYAEIEGLRGRPTSGALGAIFALIGETTVVESWSASTPDGTQVARGRGRKWWFDRTETITLRPERPRRPRGPAGPPRPRGAREEAAGAARDPLPAGGSAVIAGGRSRGGHAAHESRPVAERSVAERSRHRPSPKDVAGEGKTPKAIDLTVEVEDADGRTARLPLGRFRIR